VTTPAMPERRILSIRWRNSGESRCSACSSDIDIKELENNFKLICAVAEPWPPAT
jgi:hypothetical protein